MASINITYSKITPAAESGYQNNHFQVDNTDPNNPHVSCETPFATGSVAGLLKITGDIGGTYSTPKITGLQGTPVANSAPGSGQFLQIIGGSWTPHTLVWNDISDATFTGDVSNVAKALTVIGLHGVLFDAPTTDGTTPVYVSADGKVEWQAPFGTGAGGSTAGVRTNVVLTTASIAGDSLSLALGTVGLNRSFLLTKVQADRACRIRLYETAAARLADTGLSSSGTPTVDRSKDIPPVPGTQHGVICDLYLDTSDKYTVWRCSPPIVGNNNESIPNSSIQYAITNLSGSAHSVQVTFSFIGTEAS
ncbi:MAG TPA: hypothetical protein VFA89_20900 [Terriglobales bacterium]|nr:hypothetical protein [Terriglobales bacterium]